MLSTDYYATLGVSRDATSEQIKKAYRRLAMKYHPDVADTPDAAEKFKQIGEAYDVLGDPNKRSVFDRGGDPMGPGGFGAGGFGFPGGFDFTNLVDAMFGGQMSGRGPRSRTQRGQDMLVRIALTLAEAAFGITKALKVDAAVVCSSCNGSGSAGGAPTACTACHGRGEVTVVQRSFLGDIRTSQPCPSCRGYGTIIPVPCGECAGEGRVRSRRTVNVKIPAGVANGNRVHLEAQGEAGPGGGPAGDLYVEVSVRKHDVFTRDGDNLEVTVTIPMTAAALGTEVTLATLEAERDDLDPAQGAVQVDVPAGIQAGTRLVVPGRGVPRLRGGGRGELGVTFVVATPTRLDDAQRDLLRRLAEQRGETSPEATVEKRGGVFGWLKEAFS